MSAKKITLARLHRFLLLVVRLARRNKEEIRSMKAAQRTLYAMLAVMEEKMAGYEADYVNDIPESAEQEDEGTATSQMVLAPMTGTGMDSCFNCFYSVPRDAGGPIVYRCTNPSSQDMYKKEHGAGSWCAHHDKVEHRTSKYTPTMGTCGTVHTPTNIPKSYKVADVKQMIVEFRDNGSTVVNERVLGEMIERSKKETFVCYEK